MTTTRIQRLSVTPIKGLGLHYPDRLRLAGHGAEGDREFFLATEDDSLLSLTRTGAWAHLRAEYSPEHRELALFDADRELCRPRPNRMGGPAWTSTGHAGSSPIASPDPGTNCSPT